MQTNQIIEEYILAHSELQDSILEELSRETNTRIYHPQRMSSHLQGLTLGMFCRMIRPKTVLEIGTFTGYGSISIAWNIEDGAILYTIEISDELAEFASHYFERAGVSDKIRLLTGDASDLIPKIEAVFDLVFIDGNKKEYPDYYRAVIDKVKPGGYILADNALWYGKVVNPEPGQGDHFTRGIMEFNDLVQNDARVENILLKLGDGLMIARKK